jgi:cytochrome b561
MAKRRIAFLEPFRRMLGYWHSFHLPFAFFMYVAAVIHIAAALMFGI